MNNPVRTSGEESDGEQIIFISDWNITCSSAFSKFRSIARSTFDVIFQWARIQLNATKFTERSSRHIIFNNFTRQILGRDPAVGRDLERTLIDKINVSFFTKSRHDLKVCFLLYTFLPYPKPQE